MSRGRKPPARKPRAGCLGAMLGLAVFGTLIVLGVLVTPLVAVFYLATIGTVGVLKAVADKG